MAKRKVRLTFCIGLLLSSLFGLATWVRAERLPVKSYTTADGLAFTRISRIVRDLRGFLWFCTADGLSQFDGSRFTNYNLEDGLPSTSINCLLETRNGTYWVATNGGGVARLNSSRSPHAMAQAETQPRFTAYRISNDAVTNRVNVLFEDNAGVLWAGTDGGLFRMDEAKGEFHSVELQIPSRPDLSVQVWALVEGNDGTLWIGTKFGLTHRLADGRMIHYKIQPAATGDSVWSLLKDSENQLWLAHDTGVIVFKPQSDLEMNIESGHSLKIQNARRYTTGTGTGIHVRTVFQSSGGQIWALDTSPGLSAFNGKTFQPYSIKQFVEKTSLSTMAEDRAGNLWLGTSTNGALRIAMQGFTIYDTDDGLGPVIGSVFEGHAGELYVSSKWLISRFDGNRFVSVKPNLPRSVTNTDWRPAGNVVVDRAGEWWVGTRVGLYRFAKVNRFEQLQTARVKAVYTRKDGLADDDVTHLFEGSNGDLWIAGFSAGREVLTRWERATESFHRYSEADGLRPFTTINAFCEDRAGNLWIAFREGGLARYREGRFTMLTESDGVPAGSIRTLYRDQSGRLWFSQQQVGALFRIDDTEATTPKLIAFTKDDGLSTHRLGNITSDNTGRIYVDNLRGIDQLDPTTLSTRHYTSADGIDTGEWTCAFHDRQGNLWFGTTKGLLRLIPQLARDGAPPTVSIDELHIAGTAYPVSALGEQEIAGLEVEQNQNPIQIGFFGLSFSAGESLRFQYKLEGASSDWSASTEQHSVNFANLAPGSYRFLVRAISTSGVMSEEPAVVAFKILPPIWRRWWFLSLTALFVYFMAFAFARSRIAHVRAVSESEKRFRTLAETASDAIITINEESQIIYVNKAAERVFGFTEREMLGSALTILMPEHLRPLHQAGFSRYQRTGKRHIAWEAIELAGRHKNGSELMLELSFGEFTRDGRRYFTGIVRDISERKRLEAERREAAEALQASREERLRDLERVRRRIATDLHDDIGSSLTQISLLSEVMRRKVESLGDSFSRPLADIAGMSRELVDAMSDIVWAINPQKDLLSDLVHRMRHFATQVFIARQIEFTFHAPEREHDIVMGANMRRELFLIFKEGINNIVRHSSCTQAEIEFQADAESVCLQLSDNGRGFDLSQKREGHGLMSMRERTEGLGGSLTITSQPGQGARLTLKIPLPQKETEPPRSPEKKFASPT